MSEFERRFRPEVAGLSFEDHMYGQAMVTAMAAIAEGEGRGGEAGNFWQMIVYSQDMMISLDPDGAFGYALMSALHEAASDSCWPAYDVWYQGNGLQMLTDERMQPYLTPYFEERTGYHLAAQLQAFMAMPVPYAEIKGIEDLGLSPECFRSFSSVLLVLGIDMTVDTPDVRALRATAGRLLQDPEFRRIVGIYRTIDDCAPMANKLLGYEVVEKNLW